MIVLIVICAVVAAFFLAGTNVGRVLIGGLLAGIAGLALAFLASLPAAWLIMLGVGMWHAKAHAVPTIGFWPTWVICLGLGVIVSLHNGKD